jgi:hypothetical protein
MKMKRILPLLLLFGMLFSLAACGGEEGDLSADIAQGVAATQTKMAWEASVDAVLQTETVEEAAAAESEEPEPTPESEVVHTTRPEETHKELANTYLTDFNSIDYAEEGSTYGDQFFINRYERPFTVEMAEYRSYLDIILSELFVSPPWIYVDVYFSDDLPESNTAFYALELDLDVDDRGDFLIRASLPVDEVWTVQGISVLEDSNEDVGGDKPLLTEQLPENLLGDGYDQVIFEAGQGDDPDLAWIRRHPEDPTMLQFAFKSALTGNTGFLWSVWADEGLRDPAQADYNDRYTFEEAGSPFPEHQFYPIQQIHLLDSTCRSWSGFEPQGNEGNLCQIYVPESSGGPGEGYRLCYTYTTGRTTLTQCSEVCSPQCPATGSISDSLDVFCRRCDLPQ